MTIAASSTLALQSPRADRAAARAQAYAELQEMSEAMVREKGLLNYAQAALLLDVSTKRISELVRTGKLKRFDFLGRNYVSVRDVGQRFQQDLRAGRPPLSDGRKALVGLKAAFKTDRVQVKLGGFAGPYERARERERKEKNREELRKIWRAITGKRRK
jgi:hypothetical protein